MMFWIMRQFKPHQTEVEVNESFGDGKVGTVNWVNILALSVIEHINSISVYVYPVVPYYMRMHMYTQTNPAVFTCMQRV